MPLGSLSGAFGAADFAALALYGGCWARIEWLVRPGGGARQSTGELMARWRMRWFEAAATRDPRILDGQLLASLRSGVALFVSGSLIALGGAIALIGEADRLASIATDLAGEAGASAAWRLKLIFVAAVLAAAFLHFVWSHRIFGYCSVMLGAIPDAGDREEALSVARRAARLNVLAARNFNKGLRAVYLALAGLAWLLGPAALAAATLATFWVLYRREFLSDTRRAILDE
jgi:uncharacterized membrane protein